MTTPKITKIPPGASGVEDDHGGFIAQEKPKTEDPKARAREYARAWYRKNKAKGGAARAVRGEGSKPRAAKTAAPHGRSGFNPSPKRFAVYSAAYEEIVKERDGLNVILAHLGRLIGRDPT